MRADVREMLEKKFGRQVSVAKLESLIVDPHVVELRQDQQDFGLACTQELRDWNVRRTFSYYLVFYLLPSRIWTRSVSRPEVVGGDRT